MTSLSRPAPSGNWGTEQIVVTVVGRRNSQPNPIRVRVEKSTELGTFRKHLKARGIVGELYINGKCYTNENDSTLLELCHSDIEIRRSIDLAELFPIHAYILLQGAREAHKINGLKGFQSTNVDDLGFLIQDRLGIPADELSFREKLGKFGPMQKVRSALSPLKFTLTGSERLIAVHDPGT